jgi:hypothetical protein
MKKRILLLVSSVCLAVVFGWNLKAQDPTEISIQVKKDGKVIKDTTYQFEDETEAKHALKMMEIFSGEEKHMEHYHSATSHSGEGHSKTMVFISEDGEKTVIKEIHGDSMVWVDKEGDHDGVKKKNMKVIVSGDEEGSWTVESNELVEMDEDVDLEKIMEAHDGEDVKVIVIQKDGENEDEVKVEVMEKKKNVDKK